MTRISDPHFADRVRQLRRPAGHDHRPGRSLVVTQAEVFAVRDGQESQCALMQQTIMVMHGKTEKGD